MEKIKVLDVSQMKSLKELCENQLSQLQDEMIPKELISAFGQYLTSEEDLKNVTTIIEKLPQEVFEKIYKRIKNQIRQVMRFIQSSIEEEQEINTNGLDIVKEEKDESLKKKVNDKVEALNKLLIKINENNEETINFYNKKTKEFFKQYSLPSENDDNKIIIKKIGNNVNKDISENTKPLYIDSKEVVGFMVKNKEDEGQKKIKEVLSLIKDSTILHQKLYNEYNDLEKSLIPRQKDFAIIKNMKNEKEKFLIQNDILF